MTLYISDEWQCRWPRPSNVDGNTFSVLMLVHGDHSVDLTDLFVLHAEVSPVDEVTQAKWVDALRDRGIEEGGPNLGMRSLLEKIIGVPELTSLSCQLLWAVACQVVQENINIVKPVSFSFAK